MKDVIWTAFELLINVYQGFLLSYFVGAFLSFKPSVNKKLYYFSCGGLQAVLITILNYITVYEGVAGALYAAELFAFALFMLQGNVIKKLFACVLPLCTVFEVKVGTINIFASINRMTIPEIIVINKGVTRIVLLLTIQTLIYFILRILLKLFKTDNNRLGLYDWGIIISVMTISMIQAGIIHYLEIYIGNDASRILINISIVMLLAFNILIYHMINSIRKKNDLEKKLEIVTMQEHYQKQFIENANLQYDSIKKIRHDLKNNYSAISELLKRGDIKTAISLTNQNIDQLQQSETYLNTSNGVVNAVVNSKLNAASAFGINVSCFSVYEIAGIDDIDLCNLFSNALDNAVTACMETEDDTPKHIFLSITSEDDSYSFMIKNSIRSSVIQSNPELKTTREKKQQHGFGIKIIKEIAEKYNGRCDYYEQNNTFCLHIILRRISNSSV